jgi:hypothetical protein
MNYPDGDLRKQVCWELGGEEAAAQADIPEAADGGHGAAM